MRREEAVTKTTHAKVVIIGSGPAGYAAAIYAARAMLDPIMIQGVAPGGQPMTTTDVENYPGFADVIQGPWLMEQMRKHDVVGSKNPLEVTHAHLRNVKTGAVSERRIAGISIAIGRTPATELVAGQVETKPSGYIKTAPHSTATSVPGFFAAGGVADDVYRQTVTAAGLGCMAALDAERFLAECATACHGEAR
jgi:thioredoxin reductase